MIPSWLLRSLCLLFLIIIKEGHWALALFPNASHQDLHLYPYPHAGLLNFLPLELFNELEKDFPKIPLEEVRKSKVTGKVYLHESPLMQQLLASSKAYQSLFTYIHSMSFVNWAMSMYRKEFKKLFLHHNCTVNPDKVFIEYYNENLTIASSVAARNVTRDIKLKKIHPVGHDNNRLFARMDLLHGFNGHYSMGAHEDLPHRIAGFLIYLDDLHDHSGGAFEFMNPKDKKSVVKKVVPKKNMLFTHLSGFPFARHAAGFFRDKENPELMRRAVHIQLSAHQNLCR